MVEVFKTDVKLKREVKPLIEALVKQFPRHNINFDLDDCDRILRVEGMSVNPRSVISLLNKQGYKCDILE